MVKKLLVLILGISLLSPMLYATEYYINKTGDDSTGDGSLGNPWLTIQHAIDTVSSGDTININDGTYTEDLNIDKELEILGSGTTNTTTLVGTIVISSSNVKINDIIFDPGVSQTTITIDTSSSPIENIEISDCVFEIDDDPSVGIYLGGDNNKASIVTINNNIFNGPANKICNPWKIGGWFTNPISCNVESVNFENNRVNNCSIPINLDDQNIQGILINNNTFRNTDGVVYIWGEDNPSGVLSYFEFLNNDVDSTNTYGVAIFGFDSDIVDTVFDDSNFANNNRVNYNSFVGIPGGYGLNATSVLGNFSTYALNATYNWWGSCNGPSGIGPGTGSAVTGDVDYEPWLGVCITNKTNVTCAFETQNITVKADIEGLNLDSCWVPYTVNGFNYTQSGIIISTYVNNSSSLEIHNKCQAIIPSTSLAGGENVNWNVYVNDSTGKIYNNSWRTFYIRQMTHLGVSPLPADGLNDWFVTEPNFTLTSDPTKTNISYEWDSDGPITYTGPFGLENIPNAPPKESAGTLELNWWAEFDCGNEPVQSQIFYIDLTNPVFKNLQPTGTVYNNLLPEISVYVDEVYQSNSGIDLSSIIFKVDGIDVTTESNISYADLLDATVAYLPTTNLSEGQHNVTIYAEDNSGRNSELTWSFTIELTPVFTVQIHSPTNTTYGSKRVPFHITTSDEVELIEYIDWTKANPRWRRICKNCDEYDKYKSFKDGINNVSIRATDQFGQIKEENIVFFIDSKKPRISRTYPKRNSYTNGSDFYIKYSEENLKEIILSWNPTQIITDCNESGKNIECSFSQDLSSYDGDIIEYWFNVSDFIRSVSSRKTEIKVDATSPELTINMPKNATYYSRRIPFNVSATEDVTLEYLDNSVFGSRWRKLCSRCDEFGESRSKRKSFSRGTHNISIRATDKAENSDLESIEFEVDY